MASHLVGGRGLLWERYRAKPETPEERDRRMEAQRRVVARGIERAMKVFEEGSDLRYWGNRPIGASLGYAFA